MPRKEFVAFTRLDASDVNSFLMDQSVMTFADSAARDSAIPTPVEGMTSYLEDSNSLEVYDGSAWNTFNPSSGNAIINGAFEINQRNFTSSTSNVYGLDRWNLLADDGTNTYSVQQFTPGAAPVAGQEAKQHARVVVSGQTLASARALLRQPIEGVRTFAGQNVTFSFWAKAGSGTPFIAVAISQVFGSGGSPSAAVTVTTSKQQISTTWNRYVFNFTIPSIAGQTIGTNNDDVLYPAIWFSGGSDRNSITDSMGIQNNTFDIWGVQLEAGTVATPFRRNANSIQGELAACQRYYYQVASGLNAALGIAVNISTTLTTNVIYLPVEMRALPTLIQTTGTSYYRVNQVNYNSFTAIDQQTTKISEIYVTGSGLTTGLSGMSRCNNALASIAFSAEL
jgi:hypothetical protein